MQKIAIIQISEAGSEIASILKRELKAKVVQRSEVGREWKKQDATSMKTLLWYAWIVWE